MSNAAAKARRNKILKIAEVENSEEKKTDSTQRTIIDTEKDGNSEDKKTDSTQKTIINTEKDEEFRLDPNFNVIDVFDENYFDENSLFCHEILNDSDNEQSDNKSKSNKFDLSLLNSDDSRDEEPYLLLRRGKDLTKVGKLRKKRKFEEGLTQLPRRKVNVLSNTKATIIPTQDTISKTRKDKESTKRKENILINIDLKPPTNKKVKKNQIFQEITQPENNLVQNRDQPTQLKENIQRNINNERVRLPDSLQESKDTGKPIPQKRENIINKNNTFEEESVQENRDTKIPTLQKEDIYNTQRKEKLDDPKKTGLLHNINNLKKTIEQLEKENSEKSNDDPPIAQEEEMVKNIDTETSINSDNSLPDPEKLNCPNNEQPIPQEEQIVSNVEVQQPEVTPDLANNQQRETGLLQNINIVKKTIDIEQLEKENLEKSNDDTQEEEILKNIATESPINLDNSLPDPEKLNCPNNEQPIPQEEQIVSNVEVQQPEVTPDLANNQQRETGLLQNINIVKKTIDIEQLEKENLEKSNDDTQEEEILKNIATESPINLDNSLPDPEKLNCPNNEIPIPQEEEIVSNVEVQQPEVTSDLANNQQRETGLLQNINIVKKTIDIEQLEKENLEKSNDDTQEEEILKNIATESPINLDNSLPDPEKLNCPNNEIPIPQEEEIVSNVEVQQPEVTSDLANNQQRETGLLQNINIVKKTIDIEQLEKENLEKSNDDTQEEEILKNIATESPINLDNSLPDPEKLNCPNNEIPIPQEEEIVSNVEVQQPEVTSDLANNQQRGQQGEEDMETVGLGLTKAGKPRKRRKFDKSVEERTAEKKQEYEEKHSIKSPCDVRSCRKKCTSNITEEQRKEIHAKYTNLDWEAQGLFMKCLVEEKLVARRIQSSKEGDPRRTITYKYFLKSTNLPRTEVCKTFFLTTLGYKANNDTRLMTALKKPVDKQTYERGRYKRTNKIDKEVVVKHIMNYSPCISHYRREHAPKKLYLPSDLTITLMHKQFLEQYPALSVSFEYYRKVVTEDLNISFAQLGNEECEQCAYYKMHDTIHIDNPDETCEICVNYLSHKVRYRQTRAAYKIDVEIATEDETSTYYSVDLQKVVMLPRIDQYKAAIFCPRIIAFNESFVPLGSKVNRNVPYAAVWNETTSGRCQEDIISAFRAFLIYKRDIENIVLWLDNCAAQNKNWALLSFLVNIINSNMISAKTVTIKYFEPGHTFMSADSFHHQVELSLKRKDKVYDFEDFVECVRMSNSKKNFVKNMEVSDFFSYQDFSSQHKLKKRSPRVYLKDIMCVKVERGLYGLKYKNNHSDDYYNTLDFLQAKIIKNQQFPDTTPKTGPRGTTEERKREIIAKLVPLMPENRRQFWRDLPTSTSSADISQE